LSSYIFLKELEDAWNHPLASVDLENLDAGLIVAHLDIISLFLYFFFP
jgi:hypothetical protein